MIPNPPGPGPDLDPQALGGVVGIYLIPAGPDQAPCLALRVIAGPKAYARIWLHRFGEVEWGWVLPSGAVRLWSDGELDDSDERADAPPAGRLPFLHDVAALIAEGQAAAPAADGSLVRRLTDALMWAVREGA